MRLELKERMVMARKDVYLSQKEAAKQLGVNVMTLNRYESGARTPDSHFLLKMAKLVECSAEWLLRGTCSQSKLSSMSKEELYENLIMTKDRELDAKDKLLEAKDRELTLLKKCHSKNSNHDFRIEPGNNGDDPLVVPSHPGR